LRRAAENIKFYIEIKGRFLYAPLEKNGPHLYSPFPLKVYFSAAGKGIRT